MFYNIEIPKIVHEDIKNFSDYIYRFSFNKDASEKLYNELYASLFSLDFLPYRYEIYFGEYRRFFVNGKYKIVYRIIEKDKKVIIIGVFRCEQIDNF